MPRHVMAVLAGRCVKDGRARSTHEEDPSQTAATLLTVGIRGALRDGEQPL